MSKSNKLIGVMLVSFSLSQNVMAFNDAGGVKNAFAETAPVAQKQAVSVEQASIGNAEDFSLLIWPRSACCHAVKAQGGQQKMSMENREMVDG